MTEIDLTDKVLVVLVSFPKNLRWLQPKSLGGNEPEIFTCIRWGSRIEKTGPYCMVDFRKPVRYQAPHAILAARRAALGLPISSKPPKKRQEHA